MKLSLPNIYRPQRSNVFTPVCDSVHKGVDLCPGRVSLKGGLCPGGLCPVGSLSRGVSVQSGLCPERVSLKGGLCQGDLPLYGNVRAVRILLECILVCVDRTTLQVPGRCVLQKVLGLVSVDVQPQFSRLGDIDLE